LVQPPVGSLSRREVVVVLESCPLPTRDWTDTVGVECFDRNPHSLGKHACDIAIHTRQDHQEFLAAPPHQNVVNANRAPQQVADVAQQLIAGLMTEGVVHLLESIEIDQHAAERLAFSFRARDFTGDVPFASATVRKARSTDPSRRDVAAPSSLQSRLRWTRRDDERASFQTSARGRFLADAAAERRQLVDV
jgi:hypothetical protein